jgi:hypothetical protein
MLILISTAQQQQRRGRVGAKSLQLKVERVESDVTKSVHNSQSAIDIVAGGQTVAERYRLAYSASIMSNNERLGSEMISS